LARYGVERCVVEWADSLGKAYSDPFNDLELDVAPFLDNLEGRRRDEGFLRLEEVFHLA
jgi:hypothetical protein